MATAQGLALGYGPGPHKQAQAMATAQGLTLGYGPGPHKQAGPWS